MVWHLHHVCRGVNLHTSGMPAYARSKLSLLMWSLEAHQHLAPQNVSVFAVHPGKGQLASAKT